MVTQSNVHAFLDFMLDRYEISRGSPLPAFRHDLRFICVRHVHVVGARGLSLLSFEEGNDSAREFHPERRAVGVVFGALHGHVHEAVERPQTRAISFVAAQLFCGEPLPVASARAWQEAAPNSIVENLYGPTELTIACTLYRWNSTDSPAEAELGIVPIGYPYAGMNVLVADENLREVPDGDAGELLMNGPQMSLGYWKNPEKTAAAFVTPPGKTESVLPDRRSGSTAFAGWSASAPWPG